MGAPIGNTNSANGRRWRAAINRALEKRAQSRSDVIEALDELAEKLLALCDTGDLPALKELGDRLDGKAAQSIALTGEDGGPVQIEKLERVIVRPANSDG